MRWFLTGIVAGAGICILIEKTIKEPSWPVVSNFSKRKPS